MDFSFLLLLFLIVLSPATATSPPSSTSASASPPSSTSASASPPSAMVGSPSPPYASTAASPSSSTSESPSPASSSTATSPPSESAFTPAKFGDATRSNATTWKAVMAGEDLKMQLLPPILENLGYTGLANTAYSMYKASRVIEVLSGPVMIFSPLSHEVLCVPPISCPPLLMVGVETFPWGFLVVYLPTGSNLSLAICYFNTVINPKFTHIHVPLKGNIGTYEHDGFIDRLSPLTCKRNVVLEHTHTRPMLDKIISHHLLPGGYRIMGMAMEADHGELRSLNNITVFGLEDQSVFTTSRFLYDIVPLRLTERDLMGLPEGTVLPTLGGWRLVVRHPDDAIEINGLPVKEVFFDDQMAIHGIFMQSRSRKPEHSANANRSDDHYSKTNNSNSTDAYYYTTGSSSSLDEPHSYIKCNFSGTNRHDTANRSTVTGTSASVTTFLVQRKEMVLVGTIIVLLLIILLLNFWIWWTRPEVIKRNHKNKIQ